MATAPAAPPPKKKKSCCGCCGGLLFLIIVLLLVAIVAGGYSFYQTALSPTPAQLPAAPSSEDIYNSAEKKVAEFQQNLKAKQPAELRLSADEINAIITRDPGFAQVKDKFFVAIDGDEASLKGSLPGDQAPFYIAKGRYFNFESKFGLSFDKTNRLVKMDLRAMTFADRTVPPSALPIAQVEVMTAMTGFMQSDPTYRSFLERAQTVTIRDGQLVIETK